MPTYSYACTECDNEFDIVQAFTDESLSVCPVCSGRLRKKFGNVGVVFKGTGFYRNDSRAGAGKGEHADTGGPERSGAEKSGAEKSGAEKSGAEKSGEPGTKGTTGEKGGQDKAAPAKKGPDTGASSKPAGSTTRSAPVKSG